MAEYYVLNISCEPGGARKSIAFVHDDIRKIQNSLIKDLKNDLWLSLFYGETFLFQVVNKNGDIIFDLDIFKYIEIDLDIYDENNSSKKLGSLKDELFRNKIKNIKRFNYNFVKYNTSEFRLNATGNINNSDLSKEEKISIHITIDWKTITQKLIDVLGENLPCKSKHNKGNIIYKFDGYTITVRFGLNNFD